MDGARQALHHLLRCGKRLLNIVGIAEQNTWTGESWTDHGNVKDLRAAFTDWDPNVRAIIETVDEAFWELFDRAPLPRWSVGRVTLLGDAAHPMLPFMGPRGSAGARRWCKLDNMSKQNWRCISCFYTV
jgi:salicylate hydroxylase